MELISVKKGLKDAEARAAGAFQNAEELQAASKALEEAQVKLQHELVDTAKERGDASQVCSLRVAGSVVITPSKARAESERNNARQGQASQISRLCPRAY